ncbi:MAG TPA: ABC transporter permease [Gaiellaceae bacterium]|nr:ABC transporter permease [Gaiellaceae bacterium]
MTSVAPPPPYDRPYRAERPAFLWLLEREVVRFLKIWRFSILGQVLSALLFVLVFGEALKGRVDAIHGIPYDRYILPGLVVQAVATVGFVNGTTSLFEARSDRYIHGVLASPLRWWEVNLGLVAGSIVREILVGAGVLLVAGSLVGLRLERPLVAFAATLALLVSGAQLGVIVGTYARSLDDIYSVETLVVLPLGFLSGSFYSVDGLPHAWRALSHLNPLFYSVESMRAGLIGESDLSAGVSLAVVAGVALALSAWSLRLFHAANQLKP